MRPGLKRGVQLLLLAGAVGVGCNSLVGNDPHQLDPTINNTGTAGAHTGGSSGHPGGGAGAGVVGTGGVPAAGGGPASGGNAGGGGAVGNGGTVATGGAAAGHVGSGGSVSGGGVTANGGAHGSGGVVGTGGAGAGGAGGMCVAPGATCSASSDCCQTSGTTPMGAVCIIDDGVCHAKCVTGAQCVSGCCAAVMDETYGVCADAATYCPVLKGVGDPCSASSECASGSCSDWCQASCSAGNSSCSSTPSRPLNSQGESNSCVFTQANTYSCFPGCVVDDDCTIYGAGYTCQIIEDVDGYYTNVCSL